MARSYHATVQYQCKYFPRRGVRDN